MWSTLAWCVLRFAHLADLTSLVVHRRQSHAIVHASVLRSTLLLLWDFLIDYIELSLSSNLSIYDTFCSTSRLVRVQLIVKSKSVVYDICNGLLLSESLFFLLWWLLLLAAQIALRGRPSSLLLLKSWLNHGVSICALNVLFHEQSSQLLRIKHFAHTSFSSFRLNA